MKRVDLYARVRYAVMIDGQSQREAARHFWIDPRTVKKMLSFSVPPGYVRIRPPIRPKLDPFTGIIEQSLAEDKNRLQKQCHTSKRIFERLRDEHGFTGGITIVKDYICSARQRQREMFVPLTHPPGHAQVDFGEALGVTGGVERKIHFLAMSLPHSDACFVKAYPGETTEAFCDGHVAGSRFSAACRVRFSMTTRRSWWPVSSVTAGASGHGCSCGPTICSRIASAARARGTTRVRWKVSSVIAAGTSTPQAARGPPMDYRDNPQHRTHHHINWAGFTPSSTKPPRCKASSRSQVMHFYSGQLMQFCSGVDTPARDMLRPVGTLLENTVARTSYPSAQPEIIDNVLAPPICSSW